MNEYWSDPYWDTIYFPELYWRTSQVIPEQITPPVFILCTLYHCTVISVVTAGISVIKLKDKNKMIILDNKVNEGESAWVEVSCRDKNGDAVTPTAFHYWLTDEDGNTINNRDNVEITGLSETVVIELTPDDTALTPSDKRYAESRVITVKYIYNSVYGNDKTKTEAIRILIEPLPGI